MNKKTSRAELNRRVALLSESQATPLAALSPQALKKRLRVLLNRVSADVYNAWSGQERAEQVRWRGSNATTLQGQQHWWSAWYELSFDDAGAASAPARQDEERAADEEADIDTISVHATAVHIKQAQYIHKYHWYKHVHMTRQQVQAHIHAQVHACRYPCNPSFRDRAHSAGLLRSRTYRC